METIIGLGNAGCAIADRFAQYPQYEVYKMDVGLKRTPRTYGLKNVTTPEEQEENLDEEVTNEVEFVWISNSILMRFRFVLVFLF